MRAYARTFYFLFVPRERRVTFNDKESIGVDAALSPPPNPLPVGEGITPLRAGFSYEYHPVAPQ
jgi:hypothetical protein